MRKWSRNFNLIDEQGKTRIAMWVKLLQLPIEYFTPIPLHKLGSKHKKTIKMNDRNYLCDKRDLSNYASNVT